MSKRSPRYICRRCGKGKDPSWQEVEFGRVFCNTCRGTCDPSDKELTQLKTLALSPVAHNQRVPRTPLTREQAKEIQEEKHDTGKS